MKKTIGCLRSPGKYQCWWFWTHRRGRKLRDCGRRVNATMFSLMLPRLYVIGGEGIISVIQQQDPDHYELINNVASGIGIRTGYYFAKRDRFYVGVPAKG